MSMNTAIVDALIQAVLALSPEEQALFETKLHQKNWQDTLKQVTEFADAVRDRRGGQPLYPSLSQYVHIAREERTQQQDEFLKTVLPSYNPLLTHNS